METVAVAMWTGCCVKCGITFGFPEQTRVHRREAQKKIYCPNGHKNFWSKDKSVDAERLKLIHDAEQAEGKIADLEAQLSSKIETEISGQAAPAPANPATVDSYTFDEPRPCPHCGTKYRNCKFFHAHVEKCAALKDSDPYTHDGKRMKCQRCGRKVRYIKTMISHLQKRHGLTWTMQDHGRWCTRTNVNALTVTE